jgi:DNA modification methylase
VPWDNVDGKRNARSVWTIPVQPYRGAHFATFPLELARRAVLAGSAPGDLVLDPFGGRGTVARVALEAGRRAWHIDLGYHDLAREYIVHGQPIMAPLVDLVTPCLPK